MTDKRVLVVSYFYPPYQSIGAVRVSPSSFLWKLPIRRAWLLALCRIWSGTLSGRAESVSLQSSRCPPFRPISGITQNSTVQQ